MAIFKPYKIPSSQLSSLPISEGQFIVTTDNKNIYVDTSASTRIKINEDDLSSLEFVIVQELPTENIDPNKIYLIDSGSAPSGGGGSSVTYTISKSGTTLTLTGSDGSTSTVTLDTVPTKTSDLTNDSGYITNSVSNLTNYYTTSQTYTQTEVNNLIGAVSTLNLQIVNSLPTSDISTTTIYLVLKTTGETQNVYDEFVYANNAWEKIGDTKVDLSNYSTTTEVQGMIDAAIGDALGGSY